MGSSITFREEKIEELESMPKITTVEVTEGDDQEILEVTPNTIDSEERSQLESVLKSLVPNYVISEDQSNTIVVIHYEKSSNTYKIFATIRKGDEEVEKEQFKDDLIDEFSDESSDGKEED